MRFTTFCILGAATAGFLTFAACGSSTNDDDPSTDAGGSSGNGSSSGGGGGDAALPDSGTPADAGPDAPTGDATAPGACADIAFAYSGQFEEALICNPQSLLNECTAARERVLGCNCVGFVNSNSVTELDALAAQWGSLGCTALCPAALCAEVDGGTCTPDDNGGAGTCTDVPNPR